MEFASLIGLIGGLILLGIGISLGGSLVGFYDLASIFITFGGSIMALLVQYSFKQFIAAFKALKMVFIKTTVAPEQIIVEIVEFARKARRDGLLSLEDEVGKSNNPFLKKAIRLLVDGTDPEMVRNILETDASYAEERNNENKAFFDSWGILAPGFGMIGTVIGLIEMLGNLADVSKIGPSMAVALITTFYGAVWANLFCNPVAGKISQLNAEELFFKQIIVEGILAIQAGENPRMIEEKLKSALSPEQLGRLEEMRIGRNRVEGAA